MERADREQIEKARKLKAETAVKLKSSKPPYKEFDKADKRLSAYIRGCIKNTDGHNLYDLLAVLRFIDFYDRYLFRAEEVKKFIVFYEALKFPTQRGMGRYKMTDVQVFQTAGIFGYWYKDNPKKRVCREALLFVPRKFSKTTYVASIAIYDFLFGDADAKGFVGANSYDQAKICFDIVRKIMSELDPTMRYFRVNREQIFSLLPQRSSYIRCLSSSPSKLDGLNASVVIMDEYAQADSAALKNVLTSSMGARVNPLTLVITTASEKTDTPFVDELEIHKAILRNERSNDDYFAHLFMPDLWDKEDDPATWKKVQPHLGITVQSDFYTHEWTKAQESKDKLKEFRNKYLNIFARDEQTTWISSDLLEERFLSVDADSLRGAVCVSAADLSLKDDFSAVSYLFYSPQRVVNGSPCPFHSYTDYFLPKATIEKHANRELYKQWRDKGYLHECGEEIIDYRALAGSVLGKPWANYGIGFDPALSGEFVKIMETAPNVGSNALYPIKQTYLTFTPLVDIFYTAVVQRRITIDANPITSYCFRNVVLDENPQGLKKPIKGRAGDKIDGAISNLMCFWLFDNVKTYN